MGAFNHGDINYVRPTRFEFVADSLSDRSSPIHSYGDRNIIWISVKNKGKLWQQLLKEDRNFTCEQERGCRSSPSYHRNLLFGFV
jgi:hypothetical protein